MGGKLGKRHVLHIRSGIKIERPTTPTRIITATLKASSSVIHQRLQLHRDIIVERDTMAAKAIAVIAGVGPGTGAACARRFAKSYPVVLLARNPDNFNPLVEEINKNGGKALGISTDISSPDSVKEAFSKIDSEFGGAPIAAAIFNASGSFTRGPLLEMKVDEFEKAWQVSV